MSDLKIKDGVIKRKDEIRAMHPNVSFAESTYAEFGWQDYTLPTYVPMLEDIRQHLEMAVQQHLNNAARERGYDSIFTACTYVGDPDAVFNAEAARFRAWRSEVWRYCYAELAKVLEGQRAIPTTEELIAELPPANLPTQVDENNDGIIDRIWNTITKLWS